MLPGHPFFSYRNHALYVEDCSISELALEFGTPLFVYSQAAIADAVQAYQHAFAGRNATVYYAVKANSNLSLLQLVLDLGCGLDIVSAGELERAVQAGADPARIVFSGVGKSPLEMRRALELGIACFNVESLQELALLNEVANACGKTAPISLRVNPNVDAKTHPYISTGLKSNKFGIAHDQALAAYQYAAGCKGLRIVGIDCHIGSQITEVAPYMDTVDTMLDLVEQIEAQGISLPHLDFGGGLGIQYQNETPPTPGALWQLLLAKLDARGFGSRRICVEPGRSVVGNAAVCISEVLYTKLGEEKNFCIIDAAMNDMPRPAMYQAYHHIAPVLQHSNGSAPAQVAAAQASQTPVLYDVVGPVCESGDWLGRDRALAVQAGDHLALFSAGAYCMSMASNYNTRPRAAEVLVHGASYRTIRERETWDMLLASERIGITKPSSNQ